MQRRASFYWGDGYLVCSLIGGDLEVRASNSVIVFEARSVYIGGLFEKLREYRGRQGKSIYIDLAFPLKGVKSEGVIYKDDVDTYIGPYGLSYTVVNGIGYYLTVYPPPGTLYEYAVLSKSTIMLRVSFRREVYMMVENSGRRIILV